MPPFALIVLIAAKNASLVFGNESPGASMDVVAPRAIGVPFGAAAPELSSRDPDQSAYQQDYPIQLAVIRAFTIPPLEDPSLTRDPSVCSR